MQEINFTQDELENVTVKSTFLGILRIIESDPDDFEEASFVFDVHGEDFEVTIKRAD